MKRVAAVAALGALAAFATAAPASAAPQFEVTPATGGHAGASQGAVTAFRTDLGSVWGGIHRNGFDTGATGSCAVESVRNLESVGEFTK